MPSKKELFSHSTWNWFRVSHIRLGGSKKQRSLPSFTEHVADGVNFFWISGLGASSVSFNVLDVMGVHPALVVDFSHELILGVARRVGDAWIMPIGIWIWWTIILRSPSKWISLHRFTNSWHNFFFKVSIKNWVVYLQMTFIVNVISIEDLQWI